MPSDKPSSFSRWCQENKKIENHPKQEDARQTGAILLTVMRPATYC